MSLPFYRKPIAFTRCNLCGNLAQGSFRDIVHEPVCAAPDMWLARQEQLLNPPNINQFINTETLAIAFTE